MLNIYDLLHLAKVDPTAFKEVLADSKKMTEFNLSSAELNVIKKMDPEQVRAIMEAIENKISENPRAATHACQGTNACQV